MSEAAAAPDPEGAGVGDSVFAIAACCDAFERKSPAHVLPQNSCLAKRSRTPHCLHLTVVLAAAAAAPELTAAAADAAGLGGWAVMD